MSIMLGKKPARLGAVRFKLASYTNAAALPPVPAILRPRRHDRRTRLGHAGE